MITIENWMSRPVISVKPDDALLKAVKKMVDKDIGDVIVVDGKRKPVGILTERDVMKRVVVKKKNLDKLKVKEVMTKRLKTATVGTSFLEISRLMEKGSFRRIPVTKNGKVVGVVTSRDLVRFMSL